MHLFTPKNSQHYFTHDSIMAVACPMRLFTTLCAMPHSSLHCKISSGLMLSDQSEVLQFLDDLA